MKTLEEVHTYYCTQHISGANSSLSEYLTKLGLDASLVTDILELGVADRTLTNTLPERTTNNGKEARQQLVDIEALKSTGFEILTGLVIPLKDIHGKIVNLYSSPYRSRTSKEQYLNDKGFISIGEGHEAIIVDHPLDVLALAVHSDSIRIIYSHTRAYNELLEGVTQVYSLEPIKGIKQPQSRVSLPVGESFFDCLKQLKKINLENILGTRKSAIEEQPQRELEQHGEFYNLFVDECSYRVGGLHKNNSFESLKITLRVTHQADIHIDTLDLYKDSDRKKFIARASEELDLIDTTVKQHLGKLLLALEQAQEERLAIEPEDSDEYEMEEEERQHAISALQSPTLLEDILSAYDSAGVVGERTNKLAAYLSCVSRKLEKPLAVIIQSTSAAGKSTLMEAVLSFFPTEQKVQYSAMTGQSLYYFGQSNLKHKILSISEEEGAGKISYALKILQSEGSLSIASTGKDPSTGRMETQEYKVDGPVSIILTTTSIDIDEELLNRCLVLTVDESQAQTQRIHDLQRQSRTVDGILAREKRKDIRLLMQNMQRLIQPMKVVNPFAESLSFCASQTRTRRDHEKYLGMIDAVALLHQHQRDTIVRTVGDKRIEMLPVHLSDIEAVNKIAPEILGRSLDDLPPQSHTLLNSIRSIIKRKLRAEHEPEFTRRELRESIGWSQTQIRRHLSRLIELEYIALSKGTNGVKMVYKLLGDPNSEVRSSIELADLRKLSST